MRSILRVLALVVVVGLLGAGYLAYQFFGLSFLTGQPAASTISTDPVHMGAGGPQFDYSRLAKGIDGNPLASPPVKYDYVRGDLIVKFDVPVGEDIQLQLQHGVRFGQLRFPEAIAELNKEYGAYSIRPLFRQDVSPSALAAARVRAFQERAKRRHLPAPSVAPIELPRLDLIFVLQIAPTADAVAVARAYAQSDGIDFAEPNAIAHVSAEQFASDQWPLVKMHLPATGLDGTGIYVAVIDSGVAFCHPDLRDRVIPFWETGAQHCNGLDDNGDLIVDDARGYDAFVPGTNTLAILPPAIMAPDDPLGHGTHVAGIIAASVNGTGIAGVAPKTTIVPVRVFRSDGTADIVTIANGYIWALTVMPIDVINNSWGAPRIAPGSGLIDTLTNAAHAIGVLVVSAAGNDTTDTCGFLPTGSEYGMSVAASTKTDKFAAYSNYGVKLDAAAPGGRPFQTTDTQRTEVLSTVPSPHNLGNATPEVNDGLTGPYAPGHYKWLTGTSMAAPHVTGLAALLMQQHPTYTVDEIQQLIRQTTVAIHGVSWLPLPVNQAVGFGRADAAATATPPPVAPAVASIVEPINCGLVSSQIAIKGYALANQSAFQSLAVGVAPNTFAQNVGNSLQNWPYSNLSVIPSAGPTTGYPTAGQLALWDTVSVPDGSYVIKLDVHDAAGGISHDYNEVTVDNVYLTHPYPYEIFDLRPGATSVYEVLRFWTPAGHGPLTHLPNAIPINGVINDRSQSTSAYLYKWKLGVADGENVACSLAAYPDSGTSTPPYTTLNSAQLTGPAAPYTTVPTNRYLLPPSTLANWNVVPTSVLDGFHTFCLIAYYTNDSTMTTFATDHVSTGALTVILDRDIADNFPVNVVQPAQLYNGHPLTLKSPKIADLDHDGKKEIVFGSMVYEWDGTIRTGWAGRTPGYGRSNPAIVNLDGPGNPDLEIVAGDVTGWNGPAVVTAYRANGTVMWSYTVPLTGSLPVRISSIAAGELIPGRGIDIVFTVTTKLYGDFTGFTSLYVLSGSNGSLLAAVNGGAGRILGQSWSAPALGKLNPFDTTEIAVHTTRELAVYHLVWNGSNYSLPPVASYSFLSDGRSDPVFADVFKPGVAANQQEITLGNDVFERQTNGSLVATSFATTAQAMGTAYPLALPFWASYLPLAYFGNGPNVMDVDLPGYSGGPFSLVTDNSLTDNDFMLQNKPGGPFLRDNQLQGNPIVGDLDGDGKSDMLRTSNSYRILGYMGYGPWPTPYPTKLYSNKLSAANSPLLPFPRYVWERTYVDRSSAAIDDVDCDHKTDVLIAAGGLLYMWKTNAPFVAANNAWPMFQHDVRNTGNDSTVLSSADAGACP